MGTPTARGREGQHPTLTTAAVEGYPSSSTSETGPPPCAVAPWLGGCTSGLQPAPLPPCMPFPHSQHPQLCLGVAGRVCGGHRRAARGWVERGRKWATRQRTPMSHPCSHHPPLQGTRVQHQLCPSHTGVANRSQPQTRGPQAGTLHWPHNPRRKPPQPVESCPTGAVPASPVPAEAGTWQQLEAVPIPQLVTSGPPAPRAVTQDIFSPVPRDNCQAAETQPRLKI